MRNDEAVLASPEEGEIVGDEEWHRVSYRKKRYEGNHRVDRMNRQFTSFFVSNLPVGTTEGDVKEVFMAFGKVMDVYVARKKDKNGGWFAFVRFPLTVNGRLLEMTMKDVKMGSCKLSVNLAKFDKEGNKTNRLEPVMPASRPKIFFAGARVPIKQSFVRADMNYRSFRDAVSGVMPMNLQQNVITFQNKECVASSIWKESSLLGRVMNLPYLCAMDQFAKSCKTPLCVRYVGGLHVLLSFHSKANALDFLNDEKCSWVKWFTCLEVWNGQPPPFDRIAWLRIRGVPLNLWDCLTFQEIGKRYGEVLFNSSASWDDLDLSFESMAVLVKNCDKINEKISLEWGDKLYICWVSEEENNWCPDFLPAGKEIIPAKLPMDQVPSEDSEMSQLPKSPEFQPEVLVSSENSDMSPGNIGKSPEFLGDATTASNPKVDGSSPAFNVHVGFNNINSPDTLINGEFINNTFGLGVGANNDLHHVPTSHDMEISSNTISDNLVDIANSGFDDGCVNSTDLGSDPFDLMPIIEKTGYGSYNNKNKNQLGSTRFKKPRGSCHSLKLWPKFTGRKSKIPDLNVEFTPRGRNKKKGSRKIKANGKVFMDNVVSDAACMETDEDSLISGDVGDSCFNVNNTRDTHISPSRIEEEVESTIRLAELVGISLKGHESKVRRLVKEDLGCKI